MNSYDYIVIEDRSTWVIPEFKKINPINEFEYLEYWRPIKRKCMEGLWGEDFGQYRYMTGNLFFYVNLGHMLDTDEETKSRNSIRPLLSDLEWELSYMFLEAKGFSGWMEDNVYTSSDMHQEFMEKEWYKFEDIPRDRMLNTRGQINEAPFRALFNKNGDLKKYKKPREAIRILYDKPMGLPMYNNAAKNTIIMGARGGGKSYYVAIAECLHAIVFDGYKYYNEKYFLTNPKAQVCIGSADTQKSSEFFQKMVDCMNAYAMENSLGVWSKPGKEDYMPNIFFKDMSGSSKPGNKENPWIHKYKKKIGGRWQDGFGSLSEAFHVVYTKQKKGGAEAGAGGRYVLSVVEETGLVELAKEVHASNTFTVTTNGRQFGTQVFLGTSGNIELVQATKEMFNNPKDYNFIEFPNVWENEDVKIGFFLPVEISDRRFKDENGNTRWDSVNKFYDDRRDALKDNKNPEILRKEKMFYPRVPSDMWIDNKGHILPVQEAEDRIRFLETNQLYKSLAKPVKLTWNQSMPYGVKYELDFSLEPFYEIRNISNRSSIDGCIVMYEPPQYINGEIPHDMYAFLGHDPYVSDDQSEGGSLGAAHLIMNPKYRAEGYSGNKVVATYIGKPIEGKDKYYENIEKLLALYGNPARGLWYEADRGQACRDYFIRKNKVRLLALRPNKVVGQETHSKIINKYGWLTGNKTSKIQHLERLRDWLLEPCEKTYNDDGSYTVHKRNIDLIDCIFTLKQIAAFDLEGNYDAVMSLCGAVLGIREFETNAELNAINKSKQKKNRLEFITENRTLFNAHKGHFERTKKKFYEKQK